MKKHFFIIVFILLVASSLQAKEITPNVQTYRASGARFDIPCTLLGDQLTFEQAMAKVGWLDGQPEINFNTHYVILIAYHHLNKNISIKKIMKENIRIVVYLQAQRIKRANVRGNTNFSASAALDILLIAIPKSLMPYEIVTCYGISK